MCATSATTCISWSKVSQQLCLYWRSYSLSPDCEGSHEAKYRLFRLQAFLKVQKRPDKGYQGYSVRVVISKGVSSHQPSKEEAQPEPRYADQQNQYMNKLLEDACKLKRRYAALKADKFIANESLKAKTAAYNKLMGQHKRLKKEKVQVESKPKEYKDQEGDATQERPRSESVRADRSCVDVLRIYCLIVARTVSKIFTR
jgi:hypothetical protein